MHPPARRFWVSLSGFSSRAFEAARAQKKFLQYTIAETVAGRGHLLKEYSLALEVFGRSKSFDPA